MNIKINLGKVQEMCKFKKILINFARMEELNNKNLIEILIFFSEAIFSSLMLKSIK